MAISLRGLNANNIKFGTVKAARLGSGTPDATTFLRGDSTWATVPSGIPPGGTTGQVLVKNSDADYDVSWSSEADITIPGGTF